MSEPKKRIGVFGESENGKSTLVKAMCLEFWRQHHKLTLVLEAFVSPWHPGAWVTNNEENFREAVNRKRGCVVVIEDASATIAADKTFNPFFTCIRHNDHDLIVVGHDGCDLLPAMRQNLNELILFLQTERTVKIWKDCQPSMKGIELALTLDRYCFVHCKKFSKENPIPQKLRL